MAEMRKVGVSVDPGNVYVCGQVNGRPGGDSLNASVFILRGGGKMTPASVDELVIIERTMPGVSRMILARDG